MAWTSTFRAHWAVVTVLAVFASTALIVPVLAPVAISDDWVYARSVEILLDEGRVEILGPTVVPLIFQLFWGALFAAVLEPTFGALRLSTFVVVLFSGAALYGVCRELGVSESRSALGTAMYLFNPLAFSLSFTFMSDQHFTSMLILSTFLYARGLRRTDAGHERALLAGSFGASLAILVRQQGVLIPLAVIVFMLLTQRLAGDRRGIRRVAYVSAVPFATFVAYYLWLQGVHGVPFAQELFLDDFRTAGWDGARVLALKLPFIQVMYAGFFVLPLAVAALFALPRIVRTTAPTGVALIRIASALMLTGVLLFEVEGRRMPYVPQFMSAAGLGPALDLHGGRPPVVGEVFKLWMTWVCAAAALIVIVLAVRHGTNFSSSRRPVAGLVAMVGLWQAIGVFPPSFHFLHWDGSLDRYLLPLLPIVICLTLWLLRDTSMPLGPAWIVIVLFVVVSVAGMRDALVFQRSVWDVAESATAAGVPLTRLDAGPAWDGYHLYEYSRDHQIEVQTPDPPWWIDLFAPAIDSSYVVSTVPLMHYEVIERTEYSSWLHRKPTYVYLLRHRDMPWPPT